MKRTASVTLAFLATAAVAWLGLPLSPLMPVNAQEPATVTAPKIPFDSVTGFSEVLARHESRRGARRGRELQGPIVVLNHPGSATSGPLYGNASTQLLEFDATGKFVREIGKGVYGLGYGHGVRFDKYDNLWVVDKGTHAVDEVQSRRLRDAEPRPPARRARRPEEFYVPRSAAAAAAPPAHVDGYFRGADRRRVGLRRQHLHQRRLHATRASRSSTRTATGSSRGARAAPAARTRTRIPASSTRRTTSASIARTTSTSPTATTAASRCSTATATFQRFILLNAPYDKKRHPVLGNLRAESRPTRRSPGRSASPTRRRSISTRPTRSRAASTR